MQENKNSLAARIKAQLTQMEDQPVSKVTFGEVMAVVADKLEAQAARIEKLEKKMQKLEKKK